MRVGEIVKDKDLISRAKEALVENSLNHLEFEKTHGTSHIRISMFYTKAIEMCRRIGGKRDQIDLLHKELNEVRKKSLGEMKAITVPIKTEHDFFNEGQEAIRKCETKADSLAVLSMMATPPKFDESRESARKNIESAPLTHMFSSFSLDDKGRLVEISGGALSDDPKQQEAALLAEMIRNETLRQSLIGIGRLEGARVAILERFPDQRYSYFDDLLSYNPFVPSGRYHLFRTGLVAGLHGDWMTCAHILIPQIENSLRNTFEHSGKLVSILKSDQTQVELDLNTLLYCAEVEEILGNDLGFVLKVSLTEKLGLGIRNKLAHGRLPDDFFNSANIAFLWCLGLHLLFLTKISFLKESSNHKGEIGRAHV